MLKVAVCAFSGERALSAVCNVIALRKEGQKSNAVSSRGAFQSQKDCGCFFSFFL